MTHHASIWLDKAAGPTARACSAVALHARRIHARKCYARSAPAPLLARRARICGRRVLLRPRCPARRGVLAAVHSAASRGQPHVLRQPAAAAFLIPAWDRSDWRGKQHDAKNKCPRKNGHQKTCPRKSHASFGVVFFASLERPLLAGRHFRLANLKEVT